MMSKTMRVVVTVIVLSILNFLMNYFAFQNSLGQALLITFISAVIIAVLLPIVIHFKEKKKP